MVDPRQHPIVPGVVKETPPALKTLQSISTYIQTLAVVVTVL